MKKRWYLFIVLSVFIGMMWIHCTINRLQNYEFRSQTVSATMARPPRAMVFSESYDDYDDNDSFWKTALQIGTTIAREVEAGKVQRRLDKAMERVDIPEQFRAGTLDKCSEYLYFTPLDNSKNADYVFMMNIRKYGIVAKSWDSSVYFRLSVKISLLDNRKNKEIWKRYFNEKEPISRGMFGLGDSIGNLLSASALSDLTEEQIAEGFSHLADYMSDKIADKIRMDFIRANS